MKSFRLSLLAAFSLMAVSFQAKAGEWIRINQVGYLPDASKVAVYVSNDVEPHEIPSFSVVDASTGETVYASRPEDVRNTGVMGELKTTVRLDFFRAHGGRQLFHCGWRIKILRGKDQR